MHASAVVAGIIGKRKLACDRSGDAVNISIRSESLGAPGRPNVLADTDGLIRHKYPGE